LLATVRSVQLGGIIAEAVVDLDGGTELVAAITRGSAQRLGLKEGVNVLAVMKATELMIGRA
jgi:molybdopterin-binding protein